MKTALKLTAVLVVLLGVAALGLVAAPHGQDRTLRQPSAPLAQQVRAQLLGGSYIGVTVRDADRADADRAKLPQPTGAVVEEIRTDSPAAKAGLRAGDVITRFDGERVRSARHFERLVSDTPDGREVEIVASRAGESVTMKVAPEASAWVDSLEGFRGLRELRGFDLQALPDLRMYMPEHFELTVPRFDIDAAPRPVTPRLLTLRGRLGVGVQDLTGQLGEYFGAAEGVLITSVDDDSPARKAGLKAGDVITKINDEAVRTTGEFRRRLDRAEGSVTLTIVRDRKEQTLTAELGDAGAEVRRRIIR
jgi:serine protease Do